MRLVTRLWLSAALLPVVVLGLVLVGVERLFVMELQRSLDQALLSQAAVESVSLFDGPDRRPHLHMATSPLVESVRPFAPEGVLFGPDGEEVMRYPPTLREGEGETVPPGTPGEHPTLHTHRGEVGRQRVLNVTVESPKGQLYTLRLTAAMAQLDAAAASLRHLALGALLVTALVLVTVQGWQARVLRRRLGLLADHLAAVEAGDLTRSLPPERSTDELASLRLVLARATHALRQARDSRERFIADAAHELRTPLTLMRTRLDLALRRERPPQELRSALKDVRDEVDRLSSMATDLLDLASQVQDGEPWTAEDLGVLVGEAVRFVRPSAEAQGLHVDLGVAASAPLVARVRPRSVRRAVDNLLSNAIRFAQRSVRVQVEADTECVRVRVIDDGPGIDRAEREAVFEPFHRASGAAKGSGTGLGLALVREVAESHGGRAYVAAAGPGAELVLELGVLER